MKLPAARDAYDASNERQTRAALETADAANFKKGQDVRLARGERLILKSPDGASWLVEVNDAGNLSASAA